MTTTPALSAPSMLLSDARYRGYTLQFAALIVILVGVYWLGNNVAENLAAKGRTFSFDFLWQRAGYDINQRLIPYTNDSTHLRAAMVGLVNTLVLSGIGCFLATILGVAIGVLKLSKNWLISKLMTIYIELFRNIPLLLWILLIYVIVSETTPAPGAYRVTEEMLAAGQKPQASMLWNSIALTNRGLNFPSPALGDFGVLTVGPLSINFAFAVLLVAFAVAFYALRFISLRATRIQEATGVRPPTWWIWPTVAALFGALLPYLGFHLEYPELKGFNFVGGLQVAHSFTALLIALSLYTAAFIAEIVRAGIQAINRGQNEAAQAIGLTPLRITSLVILPQALRIIIPPLISQFLNLTKNTSLGLAVGYLDLRGTLGGITLNQTGHELECMLLMMLTYLTINLITSMLMNVYNASVSLKER